MRTIYKNTKSVATVNGAPNPILFFGLPGAGKTSISRLVSSEIGVRHKYDLISDGSLSCGVNFQIKIGLKYFSLLNKKLRLYDAWSYHVMCCEPKLGSQAADLYKLFYSHIDISSADKQDVPIILSSLVRDMIFMQRVKEYRTPYYDDDGVLQRLLSLFALREFEDSSGVFANTVISTIPEGACVVFVKATARDCVSRLMKRKSGIPALLRKYDDIEGRLGRAMQYASDLNQRLKSNQFRVIEIDSSSTDVLTSARYISEHIV